MTVQWNLTNIGGQVRRILSSFSKQFRVEVREGPKDWRKNCLTFKRNKLSWESQLETNLIIFAILEFDKNQNTIKVPSKRYKKLHFLDSWKPWSQQKSDIFVSPPEWGDLLTGCPGLSQGLLFPRLSLSRGHRSHTLASHCNTGTVHCGPEMEKNGHSADLLESLVTCHSAEQIQELVKTWGQNSRSVFVVECTNNLRRRRLAPLPYLRVWFKGK